MAGPHFHPAGLREVASNDLPQAVASVLRDRPGQVILTSDRLEYFKWDAYRNMYWWREQCNHLRSRLGPGGHAAILFPSFDPNLGGLTLDDVGVLLQPWVHAERLIEIAAERSWIVAEVSIRREHLLFLLHAHPEAPVTETLNVLQSIPGQAILGLSLAWADTVRGIPFLPLTIPDNLSTLVHSSAQPAIYVDQRPESKRDEHRIAILRKALSQIGVENCGIVFGWDVTLSDADLVDRILDCGAYSFSSTFRGSLDQEPRQPDDYAVRTGAYFRTGTYYPLAEDRRLPRPTASRRADIELVRDNMRDITNVLGWADRWEEAFGEEPGVMAPLFDYKRREKYMLTLGGAEIQGQWFNEFAPHNWKRQSGGTRLFCAELGTAGDPSVRRVVSAALEAIRCRPWLQLASHGTLQALMAEVAETRSLSDIRSAQQVQRDEHGYLAVNAAGSATLPKNIAAFAEFIPENIGCALEIGSGYGALAKAMAGRSSRYVCVDLSVAGLDKLTPDQGEVIMPVVADAHHLPFSSGSFDVVIANNVIEHFYEPLAGLTEIRRVLRRRGVLLALIPLDGLNPQVSLPAHFWKADLFSIRRLMSKAGFKISRLQLFDANLIGTPECFASCRGIHIMVECVARKAVDPLLARVARQAILQTQAHG